MLNQVETKNLKKSDNGYKGFYVNKQNIPGRFLRMFRPRPLLILHYIRPVDSDEKGIKGIPILPAFGMSFPCFVESVNPVRFKVNTVYIRNRSEETDGGPDDDE